MRRLEASERRLAHEFGPKNIRVNEISAGVMQTRAASGIDHFDGILNGAARKAPLRRLIVACETGRPAPLRASNYTAAIIGEAHYVDAGFHIEGAASTDKPGVRRPLRPFRPVAGRRGSSPAKVPV